VNVCACVCVGVSERARVIRLILNSTYVCVCVYVRAPKWGESFYFSLLTAVGPGELPRTTDLVLPIYNNDVYMK